MSDNEEQEKGKGSRGLELLTIENVMKTVDGRRFMLNLLQYTGVSETMFNKDNSVLCYNTGKRAVGVHLQDELKEASPNLYLKMIEEDINE